MCQSLVVVVALGIHSIFEGLALGVMKDSSEALALLLAILLHKWAEALSIAVSLHQRKAGKCEIFVLLSVFSVLGPLGVGLGWSILEYSATLVSVIAGSLSAGTFMYMGASEVVSEDFEGGGRKHTKCMCYALGVVVIFAVAMVSEHVLGVEH